MAYAIPCGLPEWLRHSFERTHAAAKPGGRDVASGLKTLLSKAAAWHLKL